MDKNTITSKIIGCAIEVHRQLGPGLLESTYQDCLIYELQQANLNVQKEVFIPLRYKNLNLGRGFRIDILVENSIVLELNRL